MVLLSCRYAFYWCRFQMKKQKEEEERKKKYQN